MRQSAANYTHGMAHGTQAKEKHKAGWEERAVLGAGAMAGPALEQRPEGREGEAMWRSGGRRF